MRLGKERARRRLLPRAVGVALLVSAQAQAITNGAPPSVAFFYGQPLPVEALSQFNQIVVEPDNVPASALSGFQQAGVAVFAYVSVGEVSANHRTFSTVQSDWILGRNDAWGSVVVDPANAGWRAALLSQMDALWQQGYRAFFFDTIDAFAAVLKKPDEIAARWAGVTTLIRDAHTRFPGVQFLLNRGFEVLPDVSPLISGVVAESLFQRWNAQAGQYEEVPAADRQWLKEQLTLVRDHYGLEAIAIDYVPPDQRELARQTAARIAELGFIPWVSNASLDALGVGAIEVVSRKLLLLYDGQADPSLVDAPIHRFAAMPLEYLGYALDYQDVRQGLPTAPVGQCYAGVVTWFHADLPTSLGYGDWLLRTLKSGVRLAALGRLGTSDPSVLSFLGVTVSTMPMSAPARIAQADSLVGFEAQFQPHTRDVLGWTATTPSIVQHAGVEDSSGQEAAAVITGPWGGLALDPFVLAEGYDGQQTWILNPFDFFRTALQPMPAPVPDMSTESGRRISTVHLEPTGFTARLGQTRGPFAAKVLFDKVLRHHRVPMTVSVGVDLSAPLGELIEQMARLPFIEKVSARTDTENIPRSTLDALPLGLRVQGVFHPYAPGGTQADTGGAISETRLVEQWQRTETPRRLGPIGLSLTCNAALRGSSLASVNAVLSRLQAMETTPLWLSEYDQRAAGFQEVRIVRRLDGAWELRNLGGVHTVRLDRALGWPDLSRSRGVAGVRELPQGRYIALAGASSALLYLTPTPPRGPALFSANGVIDEWEGSEGVVTIGLRAHNPIELTLTAEARICRLRTCRRSYTALRHGSQHTFHLTEAAISHATLRCE